MEPELISVSGLFPVTVISCAWTITSIHGKPLVNWGVSAQKSQRVTLGRGHRDRLGQRGPAGWRLACFLMGEVHAFLPFAAAPSAMPEA